MLIFPISSSDEIVMGNYNLFSASYIPVTKSLWEKNNYSNFRDEKAEVPRNEITCHIFQLGLELSLQTESVWIQKFLVFLLHYTVWWERYVKSLPSQHLFTHLSTLLFYDISVNTILVLFNYLSLREGSYATINSRVYIQIV